MNATRYEEEDLIAGMLRRDEAVFSYLYDHYSMALYGIINRIVINKESTEDVLQEVFIKIWNNFDRFDSKKGKLFTWMAALCRNTAIDTLRSRSFGKSQLQDPADHAVNVSVLSTGVAMYDHIGVRNTLLRLTAPHRQMLNLAYFYGYTQKEIAEELSVPIGTIKSRTSAALNALKKISGDQEYATPAVFKTNNFKTGLLH